MIAKLLTRTKKDERNRVILLFFLAFIIGFSNHYIGTHYYHQFSNSANKQPDKWELRRFNDLDGEYPIPDKIQKKRILYLSNSHALTGGKISNHLQKLLDSIFPNEYEIIDLSSGGMFAPEFVQKFAAALNYKIDYAILSLSYIAFSDRMGLSNQAASAHSMFQPDVLGNLPNSFWFLNYDLGLYLNKFGERYLRLYRYKNEIRNYWETPITKAMKNIDNKHVFFIESEKSTRWKFPKGFTNNLFQWNLYTLGRNAHLNNIKSIISKANEHNIKTISANLPIHWDKEPGTKDNYDIEIFRRDLKNSLKDATIYTDYQEEFPVEFSTYDALHPTWYGARLHALDFTLKINELRKSPKDEQEIYNTFSSSDLAISIEVTSALNGKYPPLRINSFRRYDISEPKNARTLLQRVNSSILGSQTEKNHLVQLATRIAYWEQSNFKEKNDSLWNKVVNSEIDKFHIRMKKFKNELISIQKKKMNTKYMMPNIASSKLIKLIQHKFNNSTIISKTYTDNLSNSFITYTLHEEQYPFAVNIYPKNTGGYILYDILKDQSFILFENGNNLHIHPTLLSSAIKVDFGT